jgi:hypothetical protein
VRAPSSGGGAGSMDPARAGTSFAVNQKDFQSEDSIVRRYPGNLPATA